MKWFWRIFLTSIILALLGLLTVYLINLQVASYSNNKIYKSVADVPNDNSTAIVLGAKVWDDGSLSHALIDRVTTGVELYKAGKVKKLLMSGDNPSADYDEPTAMKGEAIKQGVPEADIVLDFAGRRTYDTCYRAKEIFDVKKAVIVSQEFHLARSIYLCENLGVESVGVIANRRKYLGENYWAFREFFSVFSAWFEMNFIPFEPITGKKEPIILTE
jgi:vancomycin permeability regulator SanA